MAMHPNNLVMTLIGAGLLWVGWFGFNAGSSVESGLKTAQALAVTQIAAASGALTWICLEGWRHGKATSLGLVSGIIAGLVAITPAAGDVLPGGALALGALGSLFCFGAITLKNPVRPLNCQDPATKPLIPIPPRKILPDPPVVLPPSPRDSLHSL